MSNVFQLSNLKKIEDHSSVDSNGNVTIAIGQILASCTQLSLTIKELSKHFGAVDHAIDLLGVAESKNRLNQLLILRSEAFAHLFLRQLIEGALNKFGGALALTAFPPCLLLRRP
jgi:hypothetical protein